MTAKLRKQRKRAHEALAALFPRSERGVICGPYERERHPNKAALRRVAMRGPVEAEFERMRTNP